MNRNFSLLTGFALGAAFMYAFDPTGGRRRRALVRDQFTRLGHTTSDGLDVAARDLSNRAALLQKHGAGFGPIDRTMMSSSNESVRRSGAPFLTRKRSTSKHTTARYGFPGRFSRTK